MDFGKNNNSQGFAAAMPLVAILTVVLVIGGIIISLGTPLVFPDQASAESRQVDQLFQVLLGIGGALFLLVQGLLLYSVIRFRTRKGDTSDGPTVHGNVMLELIWTAIPAVIVLVLVFYSWAVWSDIREPKDNEITINAIGARYAWTFEYEIPDELYAGLNDEEKARVDTAGVVASPELHVYAERPVRMVMNTMDVIHSFWVPAMRVKQDLLPGRTTEARFTPVMANEGALEPVLVGSAPFEAQRYRVVCTELCGAGHGQMYTYVNIYEDEATYMDVMEALWSPVINPPADPVARGRQLLASGAYPCAGCHMLQDEGITWAGVTGPALTGTGDRAIGRASSASLSGPEEYLYRSIYYPQTYFVPGYGGVIMNMFQPNDPDAANYMSTTSVYYIVSYLCALTESGESNCDQDTLLNVINSDNPDMPVVIDQPGGDSAEVDTNATDMGAEVTPEAEMTPEAEATPATEE